MANNSYLIFRNDDIRNSLDESLVRLTEIFVQRNIPITHAVEPANISREVADWIIQQKEKYPSLIEIMQHGYDHTIKNTQKKGEFGGQRGYEEQFLEIKNGKEIMNRYFGDLWFPAFNFPFGPYNESAMMAVANNNFKVVNGSCGNDFKRKLFYFIAHKLKKEYFLGYRVPWNLKMRPKSHIFEIDMNVSFIDKYYDENTGCKFLTLPELKYETGHFIGQKVIGVLLHHRYHISSDHFKLVEDYLDWCRKRNFMFGTLQSIYKNYGGN